MPSTSLKQLAVLTRARVPRPPASSHSLLRGPFSTSAHTGALILLYYDYISVLVLLHFYCVCVRVFLYDFIASSCRNVAHTGALILLYYYYMCPRPTKFLPYVFLYDMTGDVAMRARTPSLLRTCTNTTVLRLHMCPHTAKFLLSMCS
jgi:hypothetical protein